MSLDGFSLCPLAEELNSLLAGGRIDKIFQPNKTTVTFLVRQPGRNLYLNISVNSQNPAAYIIKRNLENPPEPPVFCMVLRKQIEGGRIGKIYQMNRDRLFFLEIDALGGGKIVTKTLVLEFMGKYSNIILTENDKIIDALRKIGVGRSRVREVLPGLTYETPISGKLDPFSAEKDSFVARLDTMPQKSVSVALVEIFTGFGPVTAREVAYRSGLGEKNVQNLNAEDKDKIFRVIQELTQELEHRTPCLYLDDGKKLVAMSAFPLKHLEGKTKQTYKTISEALSAADSIMDSFTPPEKDLLTHLVKNELSRAIGKKEKLARELNAAENADIYRVMGDNLQTYQYNFKDHADEKITVTDIYGGEPLEISLDKRLTILENMREFYRKYDKLKRAKNFLRSQIEKNEEEIRYLAGIKVSLSSSNTVLEIGEIRRELLEGGYIKEKIRQKLPPSKPFTFKAPGGEIILVGKNNFQNDRLTFKTATKDDIWLHTKDIPGSHVILRTGGEAPKDESLLYAAKIAAHFSGAQGSSNVPVDYTLCRYVKKPSGSKPGFVIFTHQKTLYMTDDLELN